MKRRMGPALLTLAALAACLIVACATVACGNEAASRGRYDGVLVGGGGGAFTSALYRYDDPERGVTCYVTCGADGFSGVDCLPTDVRGVQTRP